MPGNQPQFDALTIIGPDRREPEIPERVIQLFLSDNLNLLGLGNLLLEKLEYPVDGGGRIDILAKSESGVLFPIEVKRGMATRDAVGQLQSYIGFLLTKHPKATLIKVEAGTLPARLFA